MNTLKNFVNFRLTHADKVAEADGYPLKMENCKKYINMKELIIYGNSIQEGKAAPDNPVDVQSVGDISINLLPDVRDIYNGNGAEDSEVAGDYLECAEDGRECVRFISATVCKYTKIKFKENTQYTFSFDCKAVKRSNYTSFPPYEIPLCIYYTNGVRKFITVTNDGVWRKVTFTSAADCTISYIGTISFDNRDYIYIDINTFQIEEGIAATPYEPYGKYKIPLIIKSGEDIKTINIFLKEPLRKLGDYADYIDFKNNKVVRTIGERLITATTFSKISVKPDSINCLLWVSYLPDCLFPNQVSRCNYFSRGFDVVNTFWVTDALYFCLPTDTYPGETEANAWLKSVSESDNPIKLTYPLSTSREEQLDISLPKLKAETSTIEIDTSLAPSNAYGKYIKR